MRLLNRIATPILALLVFPAVIFLPMFRIMVASGLGSGTTKVNMLDNFGLGEFISLKNIYDGFQNGFGKDNSIWAALIEGFDEEKKQQLLELIPGQGWFITFAVALIITLISALVLAIVAAASKRPGFSVICSVFSIGFAMFTNFAFTKFSDPIVNGSFDVKAVLEILFGEKASSLTSGALGSLVQTFFGNFISVDYMQLSIAHTAIILIFAVALILGVAAHIDYKYREA